MPPHNKPAASLLNTKAPSPTSRTGTTTRDQITTLRRTLSQTGTRPVITGETLSTIYRVLPSDNEIANLYSVILVTVSLTDEPTTFETSTTATQDAVGTGDPRPEADTPPKKSNKGVIIVVVGGLLAAILLCILVFILFSRRRRQQSDNQSNLTTINDPIHETSKLNLPGFLATFRLGLGFPIHTRNASPTQSLATGLTTTVWTGPKTAEPRTTDRPQEIATPETLYGRRFSEERRGYAVAGWHEMVSPPPSEVGSPNPYEVGSPGWPPPGEEEGETRPGTHRLQLSAELEAPKKIHEMPG